MCRLQGQCGVDYALRLYFQPKVCEAAAPLNGRRPPHAEARIGCREWVESGSKRSGVREAEIEIEIEIEKEKE